MSYNIGDIGTALQCITSSSEQETKKQALQFLEHFQKSPEAWNLCHEALASNGGQISLELQVFSAQTLRNKVTYDLSQLDGHLFTFKDSLLQLITQHSQKLIVTQLSVALARLAIQFLEWREPIAEIIGSLRQFPSKLLEFLKILPEETLDIKSTPLSEDEFRSRTHELIDQIAGDVLQYLISAAESLRSGSTEVSVSQLLNCVNSWAYEIPIEELLSVNTLMSLIFHALNQGEESDPEVFDVAVECMCTVLKETRDVPSEAVIKALYEQLVSMQTTLLPVDQISDFEDYAEVMDGLTRVFVEAGEAWCIHIAKNPQIFKPLVSVLLLLTCKNTDLDVVKYTFPFWFNLKQMLVLPRFKDQRAAYQDIFTELVDGIITHLHYPTGSFSSREEEDKFRDFRYDMGGVLKDCTAVVGSATALSRPYEKITNALNEPNPLANWQNLEAPLFSLRTMAQEISKNENVVLPQLFRLLCTLPEHPKVRYATTLVLGRYTEWTSKHPDFLEMELNYIFNGFQHANGSIEILTASSHALMYFCQDCSSLLSGFVSQLIEFYWKIETMVESESLFEVCQGLSCVIDRQTDDQVGASLELFLKPHLSKLVDAVSVWKANNNDKKATAEVCGKIDLIFAIFEELKPRYETPEQGREPLQPYICTIWETLESLLVNQEAFNNPDVAEIAMKWVRKVALNFHIFIAPILPSVANFLAQSYASTGFGVYLWCSGSIIAVFGDDESFPIDQQTKEAVWEFTCTQCVTFMNNFTGIEATKLESYHEAIQDFFMMMTDVVMFFPDRFVTSDILLSPVFSIGLNCVTKITNYDAYITIVRFLDDVLSWGFETPPISTATLDVVPEQWRQKILTEVVQAQGSLLVRTLLIGLVTNFSSDAHPDAIGCLVKCLRLCQDCSANDPTVSLGWLNEAMDTLGNVSAQERTNLVSTVGNALPQKDMRRVRTGLKDFVSWYTRKNVSPRLYK
ncbi:mRNA transport regulator MTR10 [Lachancea thermotolerans CBS 6340]|uniref:KLTH0G03080p n=1 Tax=Lachancea thermotolerans (strain ATCC 56472 / CBS 6340 / NRRL Y-8284) TaxID=559295 RepID=C5DLS5_LACTC|nr:KLTH0G03080p [Lachancea thermotolerans CBS 6340]CAR24736.1 KLTH0G03080p [Lachancea thermotolerans CBS 6340]